MMKSPRPPSELIRFCHSLLIIIILAQFDWSNLKFPVIFWRTHWRNSPTLGMFMYPQLLQIWFRSWSVYFHIFSTMLTLTNVGFTTNILRMIGRNSHDHGVEVSLLRKYGWIHPTLCFKFYPTTDITKELNVPHHGGPLEAGDCSHPPPKMAAAENLTRSDAAFDYVAGHGSLWFLTCKYVSDRANLWYRNVRSPCVKIALRSTRIFRREAGD